MTPAPPWLAAFQRDFTSMLRRPPPRSHAGGGHGSGIPTALLAATLAGPRLDARARLLTYRNQYWLRLCVTLRHEFRLTAHLLGTAAFERAALEFIERCPPVARDLARVADGFDAQLLAHGAELGCNGLPIAVLQEALNVDQAYRRIFRAPAVARFRPSATQRAALLSPSNQLRLIMSPAASVVAEHFPLLQLRHTLKAVETPWRLPPEAPPAPHPEGPRYWILQRVATGQRLVPLSPLQGQLYRALSQQPVTTVLERFEAACPSAQRVLLQQRLQDYLAQGMALCLWVGLKAAPDRDVEGRR